MPTISHVVKEVIDSKPMLFEAIAQGIVNYANLAEHIMPEIELELGKKAEQPAVVMAIRRYAEKIRPTIDKKIPFKFNSEIVMKTGLSDITIVRTPSLLSKLKKIYEMVDSDKGETLIIIQGNYEITIVISEKYQKRLLEFMKGEKVLNKEPDLVSFTMSFSKDFLYTPGILAKVTRVLAWENINVFENISTMTELIFIIHSRDAMRAYKCFQGLIGEKSRKKINNN
jgi:aspartokinase